MNSHLSSSDRREQERDDIPSGGFLSRAESISYSLQTPEGRDGNSAAWMGSEEVLDALHYLDKVLRGRLADVVRYLWETFRE